MGHGPSLFILAFKITNRFNITCTDGVRLRFRPDVCKHKGVSAIIIGTQLRYDLVMNDGSTAEVHIWSVGMSKVDALVGALERWRPGIEYTA